jgi:hypothetical protein
MPQKSIYRQPGARTYQLVHRSQRDPLIHDPDAPQHVLKEFERENVRKVGVALSTLSTKFNKRPVFRSVRASPAQTSRTTFRHTK